MIIGFIGTGHMGGSIALALGKGGAHRLLLHNRTEEKAARLQEAIGENAKVASFDEVASRADVLFLGVKPVDLDDVLKALPRPHGIVISMIAGVKLEEIAPLVGDAPLVRILPNTPVAVGKGFTLVTFDASFSEARKKEVLDLLSPMGEAVEVTEDKLNPGGVLTGSAPAYLDYFVDALAEAGVSMGLTKEEATQYVLAMCEGAITLAKESGKSPKRLGEEVCSPGGSTIEGVQVLLERGLYSMVKEASLATYRKNQKMR